VPIPEDKRLTNERLSNERPDHDRIDDQRMDDQRISDHQFDAEPIDEKFAAHLKEFRPLAPQPLPVESRALVPRRWFVVAARAAAAAAIFAVAVLAFRARPGRVTQPFENFAVADRLLKPKSLTMRTANALLATAPSFKDAIDEMAFPPKPAPLPADKHSALAELSKEKTKL